MAINPTQSQMPMGQAAMAPLQQDSIMGALSSQPETMPVPEGAPLPQQSAGLMGMPSPDAPSEPPYDVKLQADGSSVYLTKTDPPVVIGINKPPKLPPALQGGGVEKQ